jgi:hypothetical protein
LRWCAGGGFSIEVETGQHIAAAHYRQGTVMQIHLLNYWPERGVRHVPVVFDSPAGSPGRISLHSPGHDVMRLEAVAYMDRWAVVIPEISLYSIVVIE